MKVLLAILSCHRYDHYVAQNNIDWFDGVRRLTDPSAQRQAIRDTYLKGLPSGWDYKFFMGNKFPRRDRDSRGWVEPVVSEPLADEIIVNCDDTYRGNGYKIHAICRWALDHGYDYVLRVDDDSMLWFDNLASTCFELYDYTGNFADRGLTAVHAGFAVFISKKLMSLVAKQAPSDDNWCDDVWVGNTARDHGIPTHPVESIQVRLGYDSRKNYYIDINRLPLDHKLFALHSASAEIMRAIYTREKEIKNASNTQQERELSERGLGPDPGSSDLSTEHRSSDGSIESISGSESADQSVGSSGDGEAGRPDSAVSNDLDGHIGSAG